MPTNLRVLFVFREVPDTPDYYYHILERLHGLPGLEVFVVMGVTGNRPALKGSGGSFTFRVRECRETALRSGDRCLPSLGRELWRVRPHVVVTVTEYLRSFRLQAGVRMSRRLLRFKLILKSIPFRTPELAQFRSELEARIASRLAQPSRWSRQGGREASRVPTSRAATRFTDTGRWVDLLRRALARWRVRAACREQCSWWRLPDAHVNYVSDGRRIYGSYGVATERIFMIGNSPDTDRLFSIRARCEAEGIRHDARRVVHVGRLVEWKRVDLLLAAVAELRQHHGDLELVIAGEGPMEPPWRALRERLGIAACTRFLGGVYDTADLGRVLASSGVYVLAGMGGISINDAMCFGLPVICSTCDGTERALVRDGVTGLFFKDGEAGDLARKLGVLLADPAMQRSMGTAGEARIRREVNIYTVLAGYVRAFQGVTGRPLHDALGHLTMCAASRGYAFPPVSLAEERDGPIRRNQDKGQ